MATKRNRLMNEEPRQSARQFVVKVLLEQLQHGDPLRPRACVWIGADKKVGQRADSNGRVSAFRPPVDPFSVHF